MATSTQQTADRVNLIYQSKSGDRVEDVELPFKVMVLADFTSDERSEVFEDQVPVKLVSSKIDILFQRFKPRLDLRVSEKLSEKSSEESEDLLVQLEFKSLNDFTPEKVIESMPALAGLVKFNDGLSRLG